MEVVNINDNKLCNRCIVYSCCLDCYISVQGFSFLVFFEGLIFKMSVKLGLDI